MKKSRKRKRILPGMLIVCSLFAVTLAIGIIGTRINKDNTTSDIIQAVNVNNRVYRENEQKKREDVNLDINGGAHQYSDLERVMQDLKKATD